MMNLRFVLLSTICLTGCMANMGLSTDGRADLNISNLSRLNKGMTESEIWGIMGRPYRSEQFVFNQEVYDVWFYVTSPTVLGQSAMVKNNLTPLTFRDEVLIAIGWDYYNYLLKERALREEPLTPIVAPTFGQQPTENQNLENTLQAPALPPPAEPSPPPSTPPPHEPLSLSQNEEPPQQDPIEYDEETEKMEEDESDQNFNFW